MTRYDRILTKVGSSILQPSIKGPELICKRTCTDTPCCVSRIRLSRLLNIASVCVCVTLDDILYDRISSSVTSKVKTAICIAHRREHGINVLPLPVSRRWSPLASPFSQAISEHREDTDTGWCIMWYACLLSPGTHSSLHRGQAQAE